MVNRSVRFCSYIAAEIAARLPLDSLAWCEGMTDWLPIAKVPALASLAEIKVSRRYRLRRFQLGCTHCVKERRS